MPVVSKTFAFLSNAEGFVANPAAPAGTTHTYSSTVGNPAGSLSTRTTGRNRANTVSWWDWAGTWASLGVPANATVTAIRMISCSTRTTEYATGKSSTIGPYELRDSTGSTLIGTLWSGRTTAAAEASFVNTGAQTSVVVPNHSADTTIRIRLADNQGTGNSTSAAITTVDDQVVLEITYSTSKAKVRVNGAWVDAKVRTAGAWAIPKVRSAGSWV